MIEFPVGRQESTLSHQIWRASFLLRRGLRIGVKVKKVKLSQRGKDIKQKAVKDDIAHVDTHHISYSKWVKTSHAGRCQ